jgi:predicted Zn finger-like uncharacterized protein
MIVQCENCEARFRLDESLLKEEGSKVRCSSCKRVFVVYPGEGTPPPTPPAPYAEHSMEDREGVEETVILDSPQDVGPVDAESRDREAALPSDEYGGGLEGMTDEDLDLAFDDDLEEPISGVEEAEEIESLSFEDIPDVDGVSSAMGEAFERASRIKEDITREDMEARAEDGDLPDASEVSTWVGKESRRSSRIPVVLGLLLLVGAVYAALLFFAPGILPESLNVLKPGQKETGGDSGARRLSFEGVKGGFVQKDQGKQRFVIQGVVVNRYPGPRSLIRVEASILDAKGRTVTSRQAYAGNPFTQGELAGRPMTFLQEGMDRREGKEKQNVGIASGGGVPCMVVFQDLPEDISEFTVEAVGSSPG